MHDGRVLSREDTRGLTRDWLVEHVPAGTRIVVEPGVVPDGWAQDIGTASPVTPNGNRWAKYPTSRSRVDPDTGRLLPAPGIVVNIEDFEKTLRPELIPIFERQGYCWVIVGSTQRGRAEAEPEKVPGAIAYYRELERRADVVLHASSVLEGARAGDLQLRLVVQLLPAGLLAAGAGHDRVQAPGRCMRDVD